MQQELISKDMLIGEVVEQYPQAVEVFLKYGLHCIGCHVSPFETIEQGAMGHGMDTSVIAEMLKEANKAASEPVTEVEANIDLDKADIAITDAAISKLKEIMKKEGKENSCFRVGIIPGGCSGFSYHFDLEDQPEKEDLVRMKGDLKVIIHPHSLEMLDGAKIDYIETLQGAGFKVDNPHAKSSCGCGHSFQ